MSHNNPPPPPPPAPSHNGPGILEEEEITTMILHLGVTGSDTQTINSYITNYSWHNGRRYHADHVFNGYYWGPNDDRAKVQQQITDHLWKLTLDGKLHLAPIESPHHILDLGAGEGTWAIEMAEKYTSAHVTGIDLSPVQPPFVPSNCQFEVGDITMAWTWPPDHFDFIHIRELFGSIPDWSYLFGQTYTATKPGGWVEVVEHSVSAVSDHGTCGDDAVFTKWGRVALEMGEMTGQSFSIWSEAKDFVVKAGFVDVVEHRFKWPMNDWSEDEKLKVLGMWNQLRLFNGLEDFALRPFTQVAGWPVERVEQFKEDMRDALEDLSTRAYLDV